MFLRSLFAAAMVVFLGGCQGWMAETRLIPVSERDPIGLDGTYVTEEGKVRITQGQDGLVVLASKESDPPQQELAFDFLRDETEPLHSVLVEPALEEGQVPPAPDRTYLKESPVETEEGITGYHYDIVRISRSPDGAEASLTLFTVRCSAATEAFAARRDGDWCVFDDYTRLRAAAFDALAWYDEARMSVETATLELKRKRKRK
ncbi:MAG: hypothetical protein C0472_00910 [Erythrobacter sp.]|nr:hypothetical protein [Erythrobacter sp.]